MKVETIPVAKIHIGARHRHEVGDLEALAQNIREMGLLQAIGVDEYYHLIFGARRLEACVDILGWTEIPAAVLKIDSILAGEYAENEFRKQFTASERQDIGRAIEADLLAKDRRGRPGKSSAIADDSSVKGSSVDIAAKRAGFNSAETFERAKRVVERGTPAVVQAMDKREISISAAAAISTQPKVDQERIIQLPKDERKAVVDQIRKTKAEKEKDEARARDLRLFRGLNEAVKLVAEFYEDPKETWAGLSRVSAYEFPDHLAKAIKCLIRLQKEHPNEQRPLGLAQKT